MNNPVSDKVATERGREEVMSSILVGGQYGTDHVMILPTMVEYEILGIRMGPQLIEPYRYQMYKHNSDSAHVDGKGDDFGFRVVRSKS